jgi:penicillin amidase
MGRLLARRLVKLLAPLSSSDPQTRAALDLLRGWDAVERADSPQAALYEVWMSRHLGRAFINAVLPPNAAAVIAAADPAVMLDSLESPQAHFGDNATTKRDDTLLRSLGSAWVEMERLQGADAKSWQWGKLHHNQLDHALSATVDDAQRARINVARMPKSGGPYTPSQSTYRGSDFRHTNGPSFRVVVDVGAWDNARAVNHPGQSGDPASVHYKDLAPMWFAGEYFPLLYSRRAIEKAAETRILLVPAKR